MGKDIQTTYKKWLTMASTIRELLNNIKSLEEQNLINSPEYQSDMTLLYDAMDYEQKTINELNITNTSQRLIFQLMINSMSHDSYNYYLTDSEGIEEVRMYHLIEEKFLYLEEPKPTGNKAYDQILQNIFQNKVNNVLNEKDKKEQYHHLMLTIINEELINNPNKFQKKTLLNLKYNLVYIYPTLLDNLNDLSFIPTTNIRRDTLTTLNILIRNPHIISPLEKIKILTDLVASNDLNYINELESYYLESHSNLGLSDLFAKAKEIIGKRGKQNKKVLSN